jgi:beta-N-acetylhexosaminidase
VDTAPASLSRRWVTDILRGSLGFHGCVFADDLSMAGAAVAGDVPTRARLALAAGCDVLPILNDRVAVEGVLSALDAGAISPASQARLVRMRARGAPPTDLAGDARWREARTIIAELTVAPALTLTEGPS